MPEMREVVQISRSHADVFLDTFDGRPVDFVAIFKKCKRLHPKDTREATARAVFHIMSNDRDFIVRGDLIELFDGWGL